MRPPNPMQSAPDIEEDRRIVLHGVTWEGFEHWLKMRGDDPGVRIAYLDGELELMSRGRQHERHKSDIERLLFTWADETGTDITGTGSETLMEARFARGAEADSTAVRGGWPVAAADFCPISTSRWSPSTSGGQTRRKQRGSIAKCCGNL